MVYCTPTEVRELTGLPVTAITDSQISGIIVHATATINADIQTYHKDEQLGYQNQEKENLLDGANKTFYTLYTWIGDKNNDGTINASDIYFYTLDTLSARTDYTVSGINSSELGKFELTTGPSSSETAYVSYYSSPVDMATPHPLIKLACMQLASALCYTRIDVSKISSFRVGKVAVMKQSQAYDIYYKQYQGSLYKIRDNVVAVREGTRKL